MPTIAACSVAQVYIPLDCTVTFTPGDGGSISLDGRKRDGSGINGRQINGATSIAFEAGAVLSVEAINVDATYTDPALTASQVAAVAALLETYADQTPADALVTPTQHVTITGAMSTTAAQSATSSGTYYKARVAWVNNGASSSAKLNIQANCTNDVWGLVASQSAKRRDYQMTMGDAVILVCHRPITRLTFSSDVSITSATHQLVVTFGN